MVATYNARASNNGLSPDEMHAYHGNLLSDTPDPNLNEEMFFNFDIAAVVRPPSPFSLPPNTIA